MLPDFSQYGEIFRQSAATFKVEAEHHVQRIVHRLDEIGNAITRLETSEKHKTVRSQGFVNTPTVEEEGDAVNVFLDIKFDGPAAGHQWLIQRAILPDASPDIQPSDWGWDDGLLYVGGTDDLDLREHGITDTTELYPPIWVPPSTTVIIRTPLEVRIATDPATITQRALLHVLETRIDGGKVGG